MIKLFSYLIISAFTIVVSACNAPGDKLSEQQSKSGADTLYSIFPQGNSGPAENFTGKAWNYGIVENDSSLTSVVGNVYFEAGARSNWHLHPAGQILIITAGEGYHQIRGQPRELLKKGSVVKCPPNVLHWHGASETKGMQQLYIIPNTEKGIVDWKEPVTDNEYRAK
ncbi:MAG: cupin domain-containing protein [Chitinophagaceae bacterium]|nr:MAG: cupin domain-containing protein [Chitinophagaceae bacterium]